MKLFIIIILVIFIIIIYKNKKTEYFTNNDIITDNINNIFKTDFQLLEKLSNQINEFKKTQNIHMPDNLINTASLTINTNIPSSTKKIKINNSINFTNKNNENIYLDIFPKNYIMIWATNTYIPKGWAICDGSTYEINNKTITKISSTKVRKATNTYVTVPDFRGVGLRGININNSESLFNTLIGSNKIPFNTNQIPKHEHWLPTALDTTKDYIDTVGFNYEKMIINSDYVFRLEGQTYLDYDVSPGLAAARVLSFQWNNDPVQRTYSVQEANEAYLNKLRERYALWENLVERWALVKHPTYSPDELLNAYTSSITPKPLDIENIIGITKNSQGFYFNNIPVPFRALRTINMYYGNVYDSTSKNDVKITTAEPIDSNETKYIDLSPAYHVLNYIIKLT